MQKHEKNGFFICIHNVIEFWGKLQLICEKR